MKQILSVGRAIPAFNFINLESVQAITAASLETGKPVLLSASNSAIKYMGDDFARFVAAGMVATTPSSAFADATPSTAKGNCLLPVHLDHGASMDDVIKAIDLGFASVMIDGSHLSLDENVRLTRGVVEYAHSRGVVVEGELGTIGGVEDDISRDTILYTRPDDAVRFVHETGVDSLAIAIGTSHGAFKTQVKRAPGEPILKFDILREIRAALPDTPLVLHGASTIPGKYTSILGLSAAGGIPEEEIREAVALGINKINVDSDARLAFMATMKTTMAENPDKFDPRFFLGAARKEMESYYKHSIGLICG